MDDLEDKLESLFANIKLSEAKMLNELLDKIRG
jgi:hypothetical protein